MATLEERWDVMSERPDLHVCSMPETFEPTMHKILAAMPDEGVVLDFGCGPGRLAVPVAEARPDLTVVGIDLSWRMLSAAPPHDRVRYLYLYDPCPYRFNGTWSVLVFQHLDPLRASASLAGIAAASTSGAPLLVQYVTGDYHLDLDHRYPDDEMVEMATAAGFVDVTTEPGIVPEWRWMRARAPT